MECKQLEHEFFSLVYDFEISDEHFKAYRISKGIGGAAFSVLDLYITF